MRKIILSICLTLSAITFPVYANSFTLHSSSFTDGGQIPLLYTCDGKNMPPELDWNSAPANTQTFAVLIADPDAPNGTFYHWVVYNIPKNVTRLADNMYSLPNSGILGKTSWGGVNYKGPCPPKGQAHHYIFTVYALDSKLKLRPGVDAITLLNAMKDHVIDKSELTGMYSH